MGDEEGGDGVQYKLEFEPNGKDVSSVTNLTSKQFVGMDELKTNLQYFRAYQYLVRHGLNEFSIQDWIWYSRRWNRELTSATDMSGNDYRGKRIRKKRIKGKVI